MEHAQRSSAAACSAVILAGLVGSTPAGAHDGPDPVAHWPMNKAHVTQSTLRARLGPSGSVAGSPEFVEDAHGEAMMFDGTNDRIILADDLSTVRKYLPSKFMTVAAWVSVNTPQSWGGIIGCLQDNGDAEQGWTLGYDQSVFYFALASQGADDGDGKMTYLKGKTQYEDGRLYHVVATYDGAEMRLYVNGKLDASSQEQSGDVLYPDRAPVIIGGYVDDNESYFHHGRVRDLAVYDIVAKQKWVTHEFEHSNELAAMEPYIWIDPELRMIVPPYLQFVTQDSMTVMWETSRPASSIVHYGETAELGYTESIEADATIHEVRLEDLTTHMGYFYKIESTDSLGRTIETPVSTFQTAVADDAPFAFAVISDTQDGPEVVDAIAEMAWAQRPNFVLIPGDLVSTGTNKSHWTGHFFPNMRPLIERVAFFPVLGNHEQNARHYYDYMSLPEPEYYYTFTFGNAQFFIIDSNKEVGPGSEQYAWLERELRASTARWKFVSCHHPAYSSDENDYGDMWKGKSSHGDLRIRELTPLYDKYGVDIIWNGHIHSYERTWPIHDETVVERDGTIYMITGGGGGGLETPGPIRPWFQNNVKHGHHYSMVHINGGTLEFKAFDLEGRLFDYMKIEKR